MMEINSLFFELGYHCNGNCDYCFQKSLSDNIRKSHLAPDQVVNFLKTLPLSEKTSIMFFGGESLLYLDSIIEIIEKSNKEGIVFTPRITTNGILLENPVIERLIQYQIEPTISMDGAPYTQTCHRKIGDQNYKSFYSKILQTTQLCSQAGILTTCQSTFTPKTIGNLLETGLLVEKLGFNKWWFELECISEFGAGQWNNILLNVFQKQLEQLLHLEFNDNLILLPFDALRKGPRNDTTLYINGTGDISAGSHLVNKLTPNTKQFFSLGKNLTLDKDWEQKVSLIRDTMNKPVVLSSPLCQTCKMSDYCLWRLSPPLSELNDCQDLISCEYWKRLMLAEDEVNGI